MAAVEFLGLSKRYAEVDALTDLSLLIADGEFFVVFGPSGAGKSTLLKVASGIIEQDAGSVMVGSKCVDGLPPQDRNLAMAFESYALYPHLSVLRNLEFPLRAPRRKLPAEERRTRVREVAELLEIDMLLDRRPSQLSGGQRQRVSLGRALVRTPDLTLLDEPLAHLDARLRNALRSELRHFQRSRGVTTIYTTPDYVEAFGIAERLAVLIDGRVEQVGTPDEVYARPANLRVARIVGDPKMNILPIVRPGEIAFGTRSVRLPDIPVLRAAAGHLGIRPTDIAVSPAPVDGAIPGSVYVAEPTGPEQVVKVDVDGELVTAKVPLASQVYGIGQQVWIEPRWDRLHVFATDGSRLKS